jgi:hypothetical protein
MMTESCQKQPFVLLWGVCAVLPFLDVNVKKINARWIGDLLQKHHASIVLLFVSSLQEG